MTFQEYAQNLQKTMKYFISLKQLQEKSGQKETKYDKQLSNRVQAVKKEFELLANEKELALKKIVIMSGKNLDQSIYDIIDLDKKPFNEKFLLFATRYKQYHNMVTYIAENMKEARLQELSTKLMPLLQKANAILSQLQQGQEASINQIITAEMPPLTREIVLGIDENTFNEKLKTLFLLVQEVLEKEKKFKEFSRNAKKTKEHNWPIYSSYKIKQYQTLFNYLNTLDQTITPLPVIEIRDEKRNLVIEDTEVDFQDMIIKFKKLTGVPKGKYSLSYSFELNKQIISDNVEWCNENLEWNYMKKFSRGPDIKQLDNQIHTRTININIFKKGTLFGQDEYGRISIPLLELATKSSINKSIQVQHKKDTFDLHFEVKLRICTQMFTPINIRSLIIIKQYQPFDANNDLQIFLDSKIPEKYRIQSNQTQISQKQTQQQDQFADNIVPKLQYLTRDDTSKSYAVFNNLQDSMIPEGLTKQEVLFPEDFKITFCSSYINQMQDILKELPMYYTRLGKFQDRKFANTQIEEAMGKMFDLETLPGKVESGKVTLNQIYTYYCDAIIKDRLRIELYIKLGLYDWASFCLARRQLLIQDMIDNEWDIEDVKEIDVKSIIQKIKNTQNKGEELKKIMAYIKPQITFLKRGGEFRETAILKQITEEMLPQGLTMKQALNPEDLDYNYCMSYLEKMTDQQAKAQAFFAKNGLKEEKIKAKALQENAYKSLYGLQNKMQSGQLDAEEIMDFYSDGIVLDRLRIQLYMKVKLYEWVGFCLEKRNIYISDMKENEFQIKDVENIDLAKYI
ncbi:hypothetical protein ABPG74_018855 [Tetrahymena malaccensis]